MEQKAILREKEDANEEIINILLEKDELSWKDIIYELIKTEQMDPWDIDVSQLAKRFLDMVKQLRQENFRLGGKIVLAAALLLKIKSDQLLEEDLTALDQLIEGAENPVDLLEDLPEPFEVEERNVEEETPDLIPKTPQPRERKVSVNDLVGALEKALQVEMNRIQREGTAEEVEIPEDDVDISKIIMDVYQDIHSHYKEKDETLTFSKLLPEDAGRNDKVFTFIPVLHLDHERNVDLTQEEHFGEIYIEFLQEIGEDFQVEEGVLGT